MIRNQIYTEKMLGYYEVALKWIVRGLLGFIPLTFAEVGYHQHPMYSFLVAMGLLGLLGTFGVCIWLILTTAKNLKEVEPTDNKAQPNTNEQPSSEDLSQVDLQAQINLRGKVDIKALKPNSAPPPANSQAGDSSNASANTDASSSAESQPDSPTETKPTEDDVK